MASTLLPLTCLQDIKPPLRTPSQTPKTSPLSTRCQSAGNYNLEDEAFIEEDEVCKHFEQHTSFD